MKKVSYTICSILLLAGFFGLQAVAEAPGLSLWEAIGIVAGILLALSPVVSYLNKEVEGRR